MSEKIERTVEWVVNGKPTTFRVWIQTEERIWADGHEVTRKICKVEYETKWDGKTISRTLPRKVETNSRGIVAAIGNKIGLMSETMDRIAAAVQDVKKSDAWIEQEMAANRVAVMQDKAERERKEIERRMAE